VLEHDVGALRSASPHAETRPVGTAGPAIAPVVMAVTPAVGLPGLLVVGLGDQTGAGRGLDRGLGGAPASAGMGPANAAPPASDRTAPIIKVFIMGNSLRQRGTDRPTLKRRAGDIPSDAGNGRPLGRSTARERRPGPSPRPRGREEPRAKRRFDAAHTELRGRTAKGFRANPEESGLRPDRNRAVRRRRRSPIRAPAPAPSAP
jgi:hypothetical protein